MNKNLLKFILPIAVIGSLSGCAEQGPSADEVLKKPFTNALMNAVTGDWINDDFYTARLTSPAYLVYFQKVEVKGVMVDISYKFDTKTASKWKEKVVTLDETDYRRKLIPTYNDDGTDLASSITFTASYKGKTKDVTYNLLLLAEKAEAFTLKQIAEGKAKVGAYISTKGIITYKFPNTARDGIAIADGESALLIYDKSKVYEGQYDNFNVGDIVTVEGKLDKYNGLFELYPTKMATTTAQGSIATPVNLEATIDIWKNTDGMAHQASRLVNFANLQVTEEFKNAAVSSTTTVTAGLVAVDPEDETKTANIRVVFNYHIGAENANAIKAKLATLEVGQFIDIQDALVSFNTNPQLSIINADNIVILK